MKILTIARFLYPPVGGAETSLLALVEELAKEHSVFVLCYGENEGYTSHSGISIHYRNLLIKRKNSYLRSLLNSIIWEKVITSEIKEKKPDLVLTQLVLSPMAVKASRKFRVPTILFLRSYEPFCFVSFINGTNCDKRCFKCFKSIKEKVKHLFLREELKHYEFSLKKADLVVSNSKFMRDVSKNWYEVDSIVIPPFIRLSDYISDNEVPKEYVTFVDPVSIKGVGIFVKIANILKGKKILVVGDTETGKVKRKLSSLSNVEWLPKTKDMRRVYERTKILLMPSVLPEPFGRVCVEAMVNGIPCIASKRGGLPEVVGDAGVLIEDIYDINNWVKAIKKFENKEMYREFSIKAKEQAKKFSFEESYRKLVKSSRRIFRDKYKGLSISK